MDLDKLFESAIEKKATDIHFSPQRKAIKVLFRIQSKLIEVDEIDFDTYKKIQFELKERANVNTVSKAPQDGRIRFVRKDGSEVYFRFASVYSKPLKADKIAIRISEKDPSLLQLENLSYTEEDLTKLKAALNKSFGLVLVVGPTGSGKTTTLYACLNYIKNFQDRIILTIEDPVEYVVDNTVQIEISENVRFDEILRNFLRQDPDVIMIGEIRDSETAEVALRSALTGHLVLSTLHANTALLAISRLVDLNVDLFSLCFVLNVIQSQRLVRILCDNCKIEKPKDELTEFFFKRLGQKAPNVTYEENFEGCPKCIGGSIGRSAIYELIFFDQSDQSKLYQTLKSSKDFEQEYTRYLKEKYDHQTIVEKAASLVREGRISLSEALKLL